MRKFQNHKFHFELLIPTNWKVEETQQLNFLNLQFTVPFSNSFSVIFLIVEKLPNSQVTLDKFKTMALNSIKNIGCKVSLENEKINSKPFESVELLLKQTGIPENKESKEQSMIWSRLFIQGKRGFNIQFRETLETFKNFLEITRKIFDQMKILDEDNKKLEVTESDYVQFSSEKMSSVIKYPLHFTQTKSNEIILIELLEKSIIDIPFHLKFNEDKYFGFFYSKIKTENLKSDIEKLCIEYSIKSKFEENKNELKLLLIKGKTPKDLKIEHYYINQVLIGEEIYYAIGYGNSSLNRLNESFQFIISHTIYDNNVKNSLIYVNNDEKLSFPIPEDYVIEMDSKALNFTLYSKSKEIYNTIYHRISISLMKTSLSLDNILEKVESEMKPFMKKSEMVYIKINSSKKIKIEEKDGYELNWSLVNNAALMTGIGLTVSQIMHLSFCFVTEGKLLHIKQVCLDEEYNNRKSFICGFTDSISFQK